MSPRDVAVTGLGLVTPGGIGTEATWETVCRGEPTAAPDDRLTGLPVDFSCRVPEAEELSRRIGGRKGWRIGRPAQLAVLAAREAVRDAGLDPSSWDGGRVAVLIGCGMGGTAVWEDQYERLRTHGVDMVSPLSIPMTIPNMPAGEVSIDLGARGPSLGVNTACASGASALAVARELLIAGVCDIAVAGGTEAATSLSTVSGFYRMRALSTRDDIRSASRPFDADRDGFVLAEGSGVLVLERTADALARGARPRATLAGCGSSSDAHHSTAPSPDGVGAEAALRAALADADLSPADVDHVNAHGTSTPLNDATEAALIARVLPHRPSVTAPKGSLGHTLGAAGAVEAALTVLSIQHHRIPPVAGHCGLSPGMDIDCVTKAARPQAVRAAVSNSFGFGGHNVVLALTAS